MTGGDELRLAVEAFRKLEGREEDWELVHFTGTLTWDADRDLIDRLQAADLISVDIDVDVTSAVSG